MSWSISGTIENKDIDFVPGPDIEGEEARHQAEIAAFCVASFIESGSVGDPFGKYNFSISGHANPNHKPVPGWSNDSITINIYQMEAE